MLLLLRDRLVSETAATVPASPALAPWCRVVADGGRVLVEHGDSVVTFDGVAAVKLLPALLPLLDGTRTVEDVVRDLGEPVAPAVHSALSLLAGNRLLVDGPHPSPSVDQRTAAATLATAFSGRTTVAKAGDALAAATVHVLGSSQTARDIVRQLRDIGVGEVESRSADEPVDSAAFLVAAPSPPETDLLARVNEHRVSSGAPWLQVLPFDGLLAIVGPLFLPGESACRRCYLLRRAAASGYEEDFDRLERIPVEAGSPAPIAALAASLASVLTLRWLTLRDPRLPGSLYAFEHAPVLRLTHHRVLRVPRCPACKPHDRVVPSLWFDDRS